MPCQKPANLYRIPAKRGDGFFWFYLFFSQRKLRLRVELFQVMCHVYAMKLQPLGRCKLAEQRMRTLRMFPPLNQRDELLHHRAQALNPTLCFQRWGNTTVTPFKLHVFWNWNNSIQHQPPHQLPHRRTRLRRQRLDPAQRILEGPRQMIDHPIPRQRTPQRFSRPHVDPQNASPHPRQTSDPTSPSSQPSHRPVHPGKTHSNPPTCSLPEHTKPVATDSTDYTDQPHTFRYLPPPRSM